MNAFDRVDLASLVLSSDRVAVLVRTKQPATVLPDSSWISETLYLAAKRVFDVSLASASLLVCGPFLLLLMLAVMIESPGVPIYRQKRLGKNGKTFDIYKIRSMRVNTAWDGTKLDTENPHVTKLGAFLRGSKIDELPQLFNVIKGEMSIIGPRPMWVDEFHLLLSNGLAEDTPGLVPTILPGLIGLEQISRTGPLACPYPVRFALNTQYERTCNWKLDINILCVSLEKCRVLTYSVMFAFCLEMIFASIFN